MATGRHSYGNMDGSTTHSVMLVGLLDLPANRKAAGVAASAPKR